ncbi:MAG: YbaK/EbsC family protein, partial [Chloroflexota bacterium]
MPPPPGFCARAFFAPPLQSCRPRSIRTTRRRAQARLAVVEEDCPVDMKTLAKTVGAARLSFGNADLLMAVLGVAPGAVTPFALI